MSLWSRTIKILISNWPWTRKFSQFLKKHAGKTFSYQATRWSRSTSNFYALIGQNLTGEFIRKIYAASGNWLPDSSSWQSFMSSCDVLNCLFLLAIQSKIQLLSRLFCNLWLVCLLRFFLTNAPLVKVIGNPISDGIVSKNELTHLPLLEA